MGMDTCKKTSILYPTLTDSLLQETFEKALKLNLNVEFILLLKTEIKHRRNRKVEIQKSKSAKINNTIR